MLVIIAFANAECFLVNGDLTEKKMAVVVVSELSDFCPLLK
jgi:hypothetical protein